MQQIRQHLQASPQLLRDPIRHHPTPPPSQHVLQRGQARRNEGPLLRAPPAAAANHPKKRGHPATLRNGNTAAQRHAGADLQGGAGSDESRRGWDVAGLRRLQQDRHGSSRAVQQRVLWALCRAEGGGSQAAAQSLCRSPSSVTGDCATPCSLQSGCCLVLLLHPTPHEPPTNGGLDGHCSSGAEGLSCSPAPLDAHSRCPVVKSQYCGERI